MDRKRIWETGLNALKKYKWGLVVLALGVILMLLPTGKDSRTPISADGPVENSTDLTQELTALLCQIQGAGKVRVLLTEGAGARTEYQSNESLSSGPDTQSSDRDTVIVTDSDRNQSGLVLQVMPPTYLGAVVLCQGADSPAVKLAIIEAVSKATGLGSDRICVLRMK